MKMNVANRGSKGKALFAPVPDSNSPPSRRIGYGGNLQPGMYHCPAHDDKHPSLKVSKEGDKLLFKCHAGCTQEAVLAALKSRGLWGNSSSNSKATSRSEPSSDGTTDKTDGNETSDRFHTALAIRRAAIHPDDKRRSRGARDTEKAMLNKYRDSRGLCYRPHGAAFLPRRLARKFTHHNYDAMVTPIFDKRFIGVQAAFLNPDGTIVKEDGKSLRRNFGSFKGGCIEMDELPRGRDLLKKTLIIAEGVETALSVEQIMDSDRYAVIAAVNAGNLTNVTPPRCAGIIIAADDDEAGLKSADAAEARFLDMGFRVAVVLPPDGYKDFNDLVLSKDKERIAEARDDIRLVKFTKRTRVEPLPMSQFLALDFPPVEAMMSPWLDFPGLAMIHAPRGTAKTYLALSVAYAVAKGKSLMDWDVPQARRVLYVDGELPGAKMKNRIQKLGPHCDNLLVLSRGMFNLKGQKIFN